MNQLQTYADSFATDAKRPSLLKILMKILVILKIMRKAEKRQNEANVTMRQMCLLLSNDNLPVWSLG